MVDIGVDGSLVEFYPNFEEYIREALREIPQIGPLGEKRIRIGIAKDGSGVGAALIALVADKAMKGECGRSHIIVSLLMKSTGGVSSPVTEDGIVGFFQGVLNSINRSIRMRV